MNDTSAVVLENLTKSYGSGPRAATVLHGVSVQVPAGEFLSVMGPSGSGKSTLLNLVAGLDTPTGGRIRLDGRDLAALSDDERSDLRLRHVGMVFQSFNLFPTFTAEENVMWPLEFLGHGLREARARAHAMMQRVGLDASLRDRRPGELSGGEQQRTAIARALVVGPSLLLADEPTGNLDSATGQVVLELLRSMNREQSVTVVMVTHSALAATYGDRTIELRDGRIVRDEPATPPALGRPGGGEADGGTTSVRSM